jgi:hypothetical protein
VLIVNLRMAERFWGNASSAIGQRLIVRGSLPPREIVGVVSDVRHFDLESDAEPEMYVPHAQVPAGPMTVLVRTNADPLSMVGAIKEQVYGLDRDLPVSAVRTLDAITARARAPRRFALLLLTGFAGAALLLAAVGIYGVTAQRYSRSDHGRPGQAAGIGHRAGNGRRPGHRPADNVHAVPGSSRRPGDSRGGRRHLDRYCCDRELHTGAAGPRG